MSPTPSPVSSRPLLAALLSVLLPAALLAFAAPAAHADTTATPSATATIKQADDEGLLINVKGKDYSGASPGIYVALTEAGDINPTNADKYLGTVWLQPSQITNGSFDTDLKLITPEQLADLDPDAEYEIHTQKAHGQSASDPSQNVRVPIDIDFSVWDGPAATAISAPKVETTYGKRAVVTAEVPGARGQVSLTLGGVTKTGWVKDDKVSFAAPTTLTAKIYTARWNYLGNRDFAPSTVASQLVVRSAPTSSKVSFTAPTTRAGGRADLSVANSSSSTPAPTGTVSLRLSRADGRSVTYSRTLKSGATHVTLPRMSQGTWKAVVTYDGAATKFLRSSKTSSVKVVR